MQQFDYYILDQEGYVLLTLKSQFFATQDAAFNSLRPVLNAVRKQYGNDSATLAEVTVGYLDQISLAWECVNCGQQNTLGDCCPECAARECDRCDTTIPLDEENTPNSVFADFRDAFDDGSYNVCNDCLTPSESVEFSTLNCQPQDCVS